MSFPEIRVYEKESKFPNLRRSQRTLPGADIYESEGRVHSERETDRQTQREREREFLVRDLLREMSSGTLEILLVKAHDLKSGDFFSKTDAYAIVRCGSHSQKSNVARNQGSNPTWNQRFMFPLEEGVSELTLRIMDEDLITADDELGTVTVPLASVRRLGSVPTTSYNVVTSSGKFKGEVKLSLTFTPKGPSFHEGSIYSSSHGSHGGYYGNESLHGTHDGPYGGGGGSGGGWNQGSY